MPTMKTLTANDDFYYRKPFLLLNGDKEFVDDIICKLKDSKIAVDYHGRPKYPCINGNQYDWLIRLTGSPSIDKIYAFINEYNRQVLAGKAASSKERDNWEFSG